MKTLEMNVTELNEEELLAVDGGFGGFGQAVCAGSGGVAGEKAGVFIAEALEGGEEGAEVGGLAGPVGAIIGGGIGAGLGYLVGKFL